MQTRSGLSTPGAAALAVVVTLTTLGERVRAEEGSEKGGSASELISEVAPLLPVRLGEVLLSGPANAMESDTRKADKERSPTELSLTEFFERVGAETGVGLAAAERHACAVAQTLEEAVGDGGLDGIRSRLPDEYEFLFV